MKGGWFISRPGRNQSTRSTRLSIPTRLVNRVPACMAVWRGMFTCVGWQVTLCGPIWQVTSRSSEVGIPPGRATSAFTFYLLPLPTLSPESHHAKNFHVWNSHAQRADHGYLIQWQYQYNKYV